MTHVYASRPTRTIVRRLRVNPTTHDWLRLSWTCPWPSKICLLCEWPITNYPEALSEPTSLPSLGQSDHVTISCTISTNPAQGSTDIRQRRVYLYDGIDFEHICKSLSTIDWSEISKARSIDRDWNSRKSLFSQLWTNIF